MKDCFGGDGSAGGGKKRILRGEEDLRMLCYPTKHCLKKGAAEKGK
jgi:hypothetical protein